MSSAAALPSSWPPEGGSGADAWAPARPGAVDGARVGRWRFAREVRLASGSAPHLRDSDVGAGAGVRVALSGPEIGLGVGLQWAQRSNCSIAPRQLLLAYGLLCSLSLAVAAFFVITGAPVVLAFAGIELLLVGLALLIWARHAGDRETLTMVGGQLLVEQWVGPRKERASFAAHGVTVEPQGGQNSLVLLRGQGRRILIGRHLRPEWRADFAQELRRALRSEVGAVPGYASTAN